MLLIYFTEISLFLTQACQCNCPIFAKV